MSDTCSKHDRELVETGTAGKDFCPECNPDWSSETVDIDLVADFHILSRDAERFMAHIDDWNEENPDARVNVMGVTASEET